MKCVGQRMVLGLLVVLTGCGEASKNAAKLESSGHPAIPMVGSTNQTAAPDIALESHNYFLDRRDGQTRTVSAQASAESSKGAAGQAMMADQPEAIQRRIIYTANVVLVVKDFEKSRAEIVALVAKHGGIVSSSNFAGQSGSSRNGQWTVRIPVGKYDGFLAETEALGELESLTSNAQEVTEEFVDVEARIRNKQKEEERLLGHLKDSTGKLEEILNVEREISRVREELERLQGRMRVLKDRTELTTITLQVREDRHYVPATAPTFASRISNTFSKTIEALVEFGQNLVLVIVAIGPWLVVLSIPLLLVYAVIRRRLVARKRLAS